MIEPIRIVYEGPGLSGKTSSITYVEKMLRAGGMTKREGQVIREELVVDGNAVVLKAAVGSWWLPEVWEEVRASADAIIFVADSQIERSEANEERAEWIEATFARVRRVPVCIQWNKRDLSNAKPIAEMSRVLNIWGAPEFETIAPKGVGVLEAFRAALALVRS